MSFIEKDEKYLLPTYSRYPMTIVKGEGSFVWDDEGKQYLDFYCGHAVCILGHCPPSVASAIAKQAAELVFYSNIVYTKPAIFLAEKLAQTLLPEPYKVYFTNSGSEANEAALKIVRKAQGKKHIISFKHAFHGRSITSLGVTGIDSYHRFDPNLDEHTSFADLGNMDSVRAVYTEDTAAVICEPIQSIGGVNQADNSFYRELAAFCESKSISLIFDEVQTGLCRTGSHFWFAQSVFVYPDVITTAKGIASGLPLSVVLVKESLGATVEKGDHATTFGGGPIPCAAGLATLETLLRDGFLEDVSRKAVLLQELLEALPAVKNVLGKGFLMGIELEQSVPDLLEACLEAGIIIGGSSKPDVYRLTPPLNVSEEEIHQFVDIFGRVLSNLSS